MKSNNYIFFLSFFLLSFFSSVSQDLIVTQQNDSLNCYIKKVKPDYIHFLFKNSNAEVINSLLPKDSVTYFEFNFFEESELSLEVLKLEKKHTGVFLAADIAYSNRLGSIDSNIPSSWSKQLKNGFAFSLQFAYFFSNTGGMGILYNNHSTNVEFSGSSTFGSGTDKVNISFIAPTYFFQHSSGISNFVFTSALSIGYLGFKETLTTTSTLNLKGASLGVGYTAYIGAQLNDVVRLSAKAGIILGSLSEVEINGQNVQLPDSQRENLSTFNIGASLGFLIK